MMKVLGLRLQSRRPDLKLPSVLTVTIAKLGRSGTPGGYVLMMTERLNGTDFRIGAHG